jgi:hypothetical protein
VTLPPKPPFRLTVAICLAIAAVAGLASTCSSGGPPPRRATVSSLASPTQTAFTLLGGKPATPPSSSNPVTAPSTSNATPEPPPPTSEPEPPTPAPPHTSDGSLPPSSGRWIDVDVTSFVVTLMDGTSVVQEIGPVAVGAQIDTGAYASTQTGTFHVYNKVADLAYDPPYQTYISHWVGFDPDKANGFHSFLKDKDGNVVDASTGRVSNGCIRTGQPDAVFAFAEIGMLVYVHS